MIDVASTSYLLTSVINTDSCVWFMYLWLLSFPVACDCSMLWMALTCHWCWAINKAWEIVEPCMRPHWPQPGLHGDHGMIAEMLMREAGCSTRKCDVIKAAAASHGHHVRHANHSYVRLLVPTVLQTCNCHQVSAAIPTCSPRWSHLMFPLVG